MDARTFCRSAQFFLIAFVVSWFFWLTGAYLNWHGGNERLQGLMMFLGLSGPAVAALGMFLGLVPSRVKSPSLRKLAIPGSISAV